jgi:hypothetical protein
MKSGISQLQDNIRLLEMEIANIDKARIYSEKEKIGIRVGTDYAMNSYASNDPDLFAFMEAKRNKAQEKLEPLLKRLAIIEALAAETITKTQGA